MARQLGIAVIGCGHVAQSHIAAMAHNAELVRLVAVADVDEQRAAEIGAQHGVRAYSSVEAVLSDSDVEAVVVCVPHAQHAPVTMLAIESGRHALVEKPFTLDPGDACRMVESAQKAGVVLMAAQSRRYIATLQEARRRRSDIGRTQQMLYTLTRYYNITNAPRWYRSQSETGGLAFARAAHALDYCLWFMDDEVPVSVYAAEASFNPDFEGADDAVLVVQFASGAMVTNILSVNARQPRHDCYIIGSAGTMYFTHGASNVTADQRATSDASPSTELVVNGETIASGHEEPGNFARQMAEFATSVFDGREPISSGRSVLPIITAIEAARVSARQGQAVDLKSSHVADRGMRTSRPARRR